MIKACIFDLDGTLIDSEPVYYESDRAFLAKYGIDYDKPFNELMVGRGNVELFRYIEERFPANGLNVLPMKERTRRKDEEYEAHAREKTKAFPEMLSLLAELKRRGLPMAVASGSSQRIIRLCLEVASIADYFSFAVSAEEVERGKPQPDVFLETARRLGAEPTECLVFEDSRYGVMAAQAARMSVVAIPTIAKPPLDPAFEKADYLVREGMSDFRAEKVIARFIA
jgi:beta-phosphoglucomutase family hydrolase